MEGNRLWEAISLVIDELPEETRKIISKISEIDDTVNYMDWNDWNDFYESGELQGYVREVFGLKEFYDDEDKEINQGLKGGNANDIHSDLC